MFDASFAPVYAAAALCLYIFVRNKLSVAVQPKRLELARRGEALLADHSVGDKSKKHLIYLLRHAFSMRTVLAAGIVIAPFLMVLACINMGAFIRIVANSDIINSDSLREYKDITALHMEITFANHPLMTATLEIELIVLMLCAIIIRPSLVGKLQGLGKEDVIHILEEKGAAFEERLMAFA